MNAPVTTPTPLAVHAGSVARSTGGEPRLVLIHGWGSDSETWAALTPLLADAFQVLTLDLPGFGAAGPGGYDLESLLDTMASRLPDRAYIMGWSLGGMVATAYAARFPSRVSGLVTLGCNARFVATTGWPWAMGEKVFAQFCHGFAEQPAVTLKQFAALQAKGDRSERELLRTLRNTMPDSLDSERQASWRAALNFLGLLDNRCALKELNLPTLHILGSADQLVPASCADALVELNPDACVDVWSDTGHLPHRSNPERLAARLKRFVADVEKNAYCIDKRQMAESFSRAAGTYDSVADLQRQVGAELMSLLPADRSPGNVADIGCGTGFFTDQLARCYPDARCVGVDLASGMLDYARDHRSTAIKWLCADAEQLPWPDRTVDTLFSNFAFQWCQNLPALMAEMARVLKPGGWLLFSTVGPGSLRELREAWSVVDGYAHVNRFADTRELRRALSGASLSVGHWAERTLTRYYPRITDLTRELKGLGAHNVNRGRKGGLTGRQQAEAFKRAYEQVRTEQGLPATWNVITVKARRQ